MKDKSRKNHIYILSVSELAEISEDAEEFYFKLYDQKVNTQF